MSNYAFEIYKVPVSVQTSLTSTSVTIQYPTAVPQVYTWNDDDESSNYQSVGLWFQHPANSNAREITNIAIVNEDIWNPPTLPSGMFTRISLPIDNPSLQTLNSLGGIVALPPTPLQKAVFGRITELTELAIEDGINMSPSSFLDLWSFISKNPEMRRPKVFALDNGNFRAEWKNQKGELIGLEFCGNQLVRFVVFGYAQVLGQIMRVAGSQAIDQIQGHLEAAFASHLLKN
jgi:hypothetical protein